MLDDLQGLVDDWDPAQSDNYRSQFLALPVDEALTNIITGIGELSRGELAGERMSIAYTERSEEDEHSCFSDNTTEDIVANAQGVANVVTGDYPGRLRRVRALVELDGQPCELVFLTNNLEWSATSVAELYRCRWQIEAFFKQIKQTLQLADGSAPDNTSAGAEVTIPVTYVEPLGFASDAEALGSTLTFVLTDAERTQQTVTATIVGVAEEGLASPAGTSLMTNNALTDELFQAQAIGLPSDQADRYAQATIWFDADATDAQTADMNAVKAEASSKVDVPFTREGIRDHLHDNCEKKDWHDLCMRCISCGTCTYVCPSCYCFSINDELVEAKGERYRVWDNCFNPLYTEETSGHNPRAKTSHRFRNRFSHKFWYSPKKYDGLLGSGCGPRLQPPPSGYHRATDRPTPGRHRARARCGPPALRRSLRTHRRDAGHASVARPEPPPISQVVTQTRPSRANSQARSPRNPRCPIALTAPRSRGTQADAASSCDSAPGRPTARPPSWLGAPDPTRYT